MYKPLLLGSLVLACIGTGAKSASFTETFDGGLSGFSIAAENFLGNDLNSGPFVFIDTAGSNNFLTITNENPPTGSALFNATVSQSITIMQSASILTLDAALLSVSGQSNGSNFTDALEITLVDDTNTFFTLFDYLGDGARLDPFMTAGVPVSFGGAPGPFAGTGAVSTASFRADLSSFAGQTLDLRINIFNEIDGENLTFGIDNIAVSAVPLPPTILLLLGAFGIAGIARRRLS